MGVSPAEPQGQIGVRRGGGDWLGSNMHDDDHSFLIGIEWCHSMWQKCISKPILLSECMHLGLEKSLWSLLHPDPF